MYLKLFLKSSKVMAIGIQFYFVVYFIFAIKKKKTFSFLMLHTKSCSHKAGRLLQSPDMGLRETRCSHADPR